VVFKLDKTGNETVLCSFSGTAGDSSFPFAGLVRDAEGNSYGMTHNGGAAGYGTVFKLDKAGKETDGAYPYAELVRDSKGDLYGATAYGGPSGGGTVFKLTP
jgi:uncharacterized repeat protein (TIGR03803 family)